jgi:ATP-dependent Lhr-like helicase
VVWVGRSPLGSRDGRIALYLRSHVRELLDAGGSIAAPDAIQSVIVERLSSQGASFLFELQTAVTQQRPDTTSQEFEDALWDLVWSGCITNDTFAPLRSLGRKRPRSAHRRWRTSSALAGGRWSLVSSLVDAGVSPTERALARANMLLERYGIVSREVVSAEEIAGGFSPIYKVLAALEESGQVRRGYFIEGLSGAQFARPGVVDRLRGVRQEEDAAIDISATDVKHLAAVDPANPWGSLMPWPETGSSESRARPRRVTGASVLLHAGNPLLFLSANGRQLITFPTHLAEPSIRAAAFSALHHLPRQNRRGSLVIEKIDGESIRDSQYCELMLNCGFASDYRGLVAEAFA